MLRLTNIVFCVGFALIQGKEVCDHLGVLSYEEIGCIPSLRSVGCPESFDCSHYKAPNDACIYRGQVYRNRENINGTASCNLGCTCNTEQSLRPSIICAEIDCDWDVSENCYQTHALDSCCPTGEKCPPFDDVATCKIGEKTFKEGQYFQPEGQCLECVCKKGFKGEFVEPFCRRIRCDVELWFSNEISDGCAPAYTRTANALCCPIDYICPSIAKVEKKTHAVNSEEENGQETCDHLGTLLYEEIGCTSTLGPDGCPKSYDCSHYEVPTDGCIFKGQTYQNRELLNSTAPCNKACFCNAEELYEPNIICAAISCNWNFDEGCYPIHDLNSCCPIGQNCPPFNDLATCQVDGTTYKEGQYFRPEGHCLSCVCQKGFTGEYVEPYCRRVQCDVELHFAKEIAEGCAPAYTKTTDALCCPFDYICPSNTVSISPVEESTVSADKCIYGNHEYNINDILNLTYISYEQKVAECSCILPPHLTCRIDF